MDRSLDDLSPRFKPLAVALLQAISAAGIQVIVIDTLRTQAEQVDAIARGVSWTTHSKHLTGDAIDVALIGEGTNKIDWNTKNPNWEAIGLIGEGLGLRWGGRFPGHPDLGHFEFNG